MRAPTTVAIALCATGAQAFVGLPVQQMARTARPHSATQPLSMSAGAAKVSMRPKKAIVIEQVTDMLKKASMVFSIPAANISANDVVKLRKNMPEGCTARVVKNKLMRIACEGTDFEDLAQVTTGENCWMFVEGEDLAAPIKYIEEFSKELGKDKVGWQEPFKAGIYDGSLLDGRGVIAISKLPTKQELLQRLAIALNSVPTKLGRTIKLVPTKVGRAVKLAFAEGSGAAGEAEAAAAPEAESAAAEAPVAEEEPAVEEAAAPEAEAETPAEAAAEGEAAAEEEPAAE